MPIDLSRAGGRTLGCDCWRLLHDQVPSTPKTKLSHWYWQPSLRVALLAQRLRAKASSWFPLTPRQTGVASKSFLVPLLRPGHSYRESAMPWPAIAGQHLDSRACARCGPLLLVPNLTRLFASACAGNKALCHSRAGDRLHGCGSQTSVVLGRARLVSGFSVRSANPVRSVVLPRTSPVK